MNDLPQGWKLSSLGKICSKPQYGWTSQASKSGTLKYLRTSDISSDKINWETVPYCQEIPPEPEKYRIKRNDILVSRAGSVGISCRIKNVPTDTVFASYLIRFKPLDDIEPQYLEYYLKSDQYWRSISDFTAGIAIPNVNASKLSSLEIPVAPPTEQRRIVAILEKLFAKVEACKERLEKIPALLKRFHQSVLANACSGRLTADWRDKSSNGEFAEIQFNTALSKVISEYDQACQIAKRKRLRKPSRPTCLDDFEPAWSDNQDIPSTWLSVPLGKVCSKVTDGTHATPKAVSSGVPYITAKHIRDRRIDFENSLFLPHEVHYEIFARCNPRCGDVVIVNIGAGTATPALVRVNFEFSMKNVALLKPVKGLLLGEYLEFYQLLIKPRIFDEVTRGGAQPFMGLDLIKTIPFRLPPLAEQYEIVRRVEALFKIADQIEERYNKAKAQVDKLTQSILAKAFRGELVPQDLNDEPASELLIKIQEERDNDERKSRALEISKRNFKKRDRGHVRDK